jgi:hypothetical protein
MLGARAKVVLIVAAAVAAWWWHDKQSKQAPAAPGGVDDPDGRVVLSSYIRKDGQCYRVDIRADGSRTNTPVGDGLCDAPPDVEY